VTDKSKIAYSSLYSFNNDIYSESRKLREASKECKELKSEIIKEWGDCFKEKLGPKD
jgi:hypothetical protein